MFDSKSGAKLNNQIILIKGDRITNVGSSVDIPAGARVIDLSAATVMPGMIDAHVHVVTGGATPTHALLYGSPTINAGANDEAPATDQRGAPRITNGTVDFLD